MKNIKIENMLEIAKTIAGKPTKDLKVDERKKKDEVAKEINKKFSEFIDGIIDKIDGWDYGKDAKRSSFRPKGNNTNPYIKYNWRFFKPEHIVDQDKCLLIIYLSMRPPENDFIISIGIHDNRNNKTHRKQPIKKEKLIEIYDYISQEFQKIEMRNHPNFNRDYDDDDNERILSYKKNIDENSINDFAIIFEELTQIYKNVFNKYEFLEKDILIDEEKRKNSKGVNLTKLPSNFILYGPPGTGKTYKTVDIAASIIGNINEDIKTIDNVIDYDMDEEKFHNNNTEIFNAGLSEKGDKEKGIKGDTVHFVTFHQNYSYEEFVGGLRPDIGNDQGSLKFKWQPGIFIKACAKALELARVDTTDKITSPEEWFFGECSNYKSRNYKYKDDQKCEKIDKVVLIIDEINRANISRVFGELITLMESDKRIGGKHQLIITLPNGDKKFGVPANLIIMGTMNTADKSLALLDVALRRRFEFIGLFPKPKLAKVEKHKKILKDLNEKIRDQLNMGLQIGHSYFMSTEEIKDENEFLKDIFNKKIIPLLNEYFMGNRKKVEEILKDIVGTELDENGVLKCLGPWEKPSKD